MLKKIASLIIVAILSVSMLTGCSFIPSLIKRVVQERLSDQTNNDKNNIDSDDKQGSAEQSRTLAPEVEAILTVDANPVNELLYKIYKSEYQPSPFAEDDVSSDTTKWICTTYAIYNYVNNKDMDVIGGYWEVDAETKDEKHLEEAKTYLRDSCGVDSRVALVEMICILSNFGNNERYNIEVREMLANGDMQANLIEKYGRGPEVFRKMAVQIAYQRFGENGLVGWDLSRANQILGDAYYVGYINLEESLDLSLLLSKRIQNTFKNWDEFHESYLYGQQFIRQDAVDDPVTETATDWENYNYLKERADDEKGPLAIPFDTKLLRTWDMEEIAARKKAEEEPLDMAMPQADADGMVALYTGVKEIPGIKMRVPDGFTMAEFSSQLSIYATREDDDVSILYNVSVNSAFDSMRERADEDKKLSLEFSLGDTKIISEKFEEGADEVMYYFAMETKYEDLEGKSMIDYRGYKAKKIDDMWIGIQAQLMADLTVGITEEEAVSLMFSDVQFP